MINALDKTYPSPVDIPEGQLGKFRVTHKYQAHFEITSMREMVMTGRPALSIDYDPPRRVTGLYEDDQLWIADIPAEIRQHQEALRKMWPSGRVLVGGLGLGIMAQLLAKDPKVNAIDVVEISPEVAKLCAPRDPKVKVIVADFRDYLLSLRPGLWPYTATFIDLWRGDNEATWWEEVFPIRRLIGQRFGTWFNDTVQYWAEDIMLGQVAAALFSSSLDHWYYKPELKRPMTKDRARWFFQNIGTPRWERKYGSAYP